MGVGGGIIDMGCMEVIIGLDDIIGFIDCPFMGLA